MDNRLKVEECLERFLAEFVVVFERYYSEYYNCMLRTIPSDGDWGKFHEKILDLTRIEGEELNKLERTIWLTGVLQKLVHSVGVHFDDENLKKVKTILAELRKEPHRIRETLLASAGIIFQTFEKQFMQLDSTTRNWNDLDKIVHDSVDRVISYYTKNPGTSFNSSSITTALISGKSKHYHGKLSPRGHTVMMNNTSITTKHLFETVVSKHETANYQSDVNVKLRYRAEFGREQVIQIAQYQYHVDEEMISRMISKVNEAIQVRTEHGQFDWALKNISQRAERDVKRLWSLIKNHFYKVSATLASLEEELKEDAKDLGTIERKRLRVEESLERFVSEFVVIFEDYFSEYYLCMLRKTPTNGKWNEMAEGILSLTRLGGAKSVIKLERTVWIIGVLQKVVHSVGVRFDKEKLNRVSETLVELMREPHRIRETLLKSACIIFQTFEKQFMQLDSTTRNWIYLDMVVHDSVNRVISYYKKNPGTSFNSTSITTALISGESKHYQGKLSPRGYTVMMGNTSITTKHLFEKVVSKNDTANCQCYVHQLGYRLPFAWEQVVDNGDRQIAHDQYQYHVDEEMISGITMKVGEDIHAGLETGKFDWAMQKIHQEAAKDVSRLWLLIKDHFSEVMECLTELGEEMKGANREVIESQSAPGGVWFDLTPPTEFFVGREEELKDLHSKTLRRSSKNSVNITVICGSGGMGKTQLGRQYTYLQCVATPRVFTHIIWLNAENEKLLLDSFMRLAPQIIHSKIPPANEKQRDLIVNQVYSLLSIKSALIVIDNVENSESLKRFLPLPFQSPNISIILISRNKEWNKEVSTVHLSTFNHEDAVSLLRKSAQFGEINESKLNEIVETLHRFPMALSMAAAYMRGNSVTIKGFLEKYIRVRNRGTFKALKRCGTYPRDNFAEALFNVWTMSLKAMKKEFDGEFAANILNILALANLENIDLEMFRQRSTECMEVSEIRCEMMKDFELENAFHLIIKYAFVNGGERLHISVIPLIQEITILHMIHNDEAMFETFDVIVFRLIFPEGDLKISENRRLLPILLKFLYHFNDMIIINQIREPSKKREVENLLSYFRQIVNKCGSKEGCNMSVELCMIAYRITENYYGKIHYKVPLSLNELANAYRASGRFQEAKIYLEKALEIQKELYNDTDHFDITTTMNNLANVHGKLNEYVKMVEYLEEVLSILEKTHLVNYHRASVVLYNLGITYGELRDHRKQRDCLERALQIVNRRGTTTTEDSIDKARLINNLGNAYGALGDHLKQVELYEQALFLREELYEGEDHVEVARSLHNLGMAIGDLGNHEKKKMLLEKALDMELRHYGEGGHIEIATTYYNLGIAWGKLGDNQTKREFLEKALEIEQKHYGINDVEIVITMFNLAISYRDLGHYEKSRDLLIKTLKIQNSVNRESIDISNTLFCLGTVYGYLQDYINQVDVLKNALKIKLMYYKQNDWKLVDTQNALGSAYGFLGEYHKQKDSYTKVLGIIERHLRSKHGEVARATNNIGNAEYCLRNYQEAKDEYERALQIQEKAYKEDFLRVAHILSNLGLSFYQIGVHKKAKQFLEKSLTMKIDYYGENHEEVRKTRNNLERVYEQLDIQDSTIEEIQPIGQNTKKHGSIQHRSSFHKTPQDATSYIDKKKTLLETTLEIEERTRISGLYTLDVVNVLYNLGIRYGELGEHGKEVEFLERALKIEEDHYGDDSNEIVNTLIHLGEAYGNLCNYKKQKEVLERVLAKKSNRIPTPKLVSIFDNLGKAYGSEGDLRKQRELYIRCLITKQKYYGEKHYEVAVTLNNLGNVAFHSKDFNSAIEMYEKSLIIQENRLQEELIGIAHILNNLGCCCMNLDDLEEARQFLEEAWAIKEEQLEKDDIEVTRTSYNLGTLYYKLGYEKIPNTILEKFLEMYDKYQNVNTSKCPRTLNQLAHLSDLLKTKNKVSILNESRENFESDYEVAMKLRRLGFGFEQAGDHDSANNSDDLANSAIARYFDLPSFYHVTYL
ncbi:hypothetical protein GE061_015729 [Apolygus lucorum]|uniref:NB-ARC domain-containing protein n=1 Tax=Apolygus lucorum TaxID=248454 RepID=A0A8S9XMZ4_APOLU|nr:hypothetical protein GE061_015729 [Apolygus lucorum]